MADSEKGHQPIRLSPFTSSSAITHSSLHPEQIAHLEEEPIRRPMEPGAKGVGRVHRVAEGAAVPGEQHGARRRLVGEQNVAPEGPMAERGGADEVADVGIEDEDRRVGTGVVTKRTLAARSYTRRPGARRWVVTPDIRS